MNLRFTVGELAKLSHVSKQTLIYYDREGVFKPSIVNESNGYRYYTADQLEVLDSIMILKEMGLSLSEIRHFMQTRNEENAVALMKSQQEKIKNKIATLRLVARRLARKIETVEEFHAGGQALQWLNNAKPQYLGVQRVPPPGGILEVDMSIKMLFLKAQTYRYAHFYQIGTMISAQNLQEENFICADCTFFPLEEKPSRGEFLIKPAGLFLRGYHTGRYEDIGVTYRRMMAQMKQEGYAPMDYSYEYCVLDSLTTKASAQYVTEIQIPARKKCQP